MDPEAWRRLADAVRRRREHLGLSQTELAARARVSESTIRSIEAARRTGFRRGTLRAIAEALDWTLANIDSILAGEPVGTPQRAPTDFIPDLTDETEAALWALELPERTRRELILHVRETRAEAV